MNEKILTSLTDPKDWTENDERLFGQAFAHFGLDPTSPDDVQCAARLFFKLMDMAWEEIISTGAASDSSETTAPKGKPGRKSDLEREIQLIDRFDAFVLDPDHPRRRTQTQSANAGAFLKHIAATGDGLAKSLTVQRQGKRQQITAHRLESRLAIARDIRQSARRMRALKQALGGFCNVATMALDGRNFQSLAKETARVEAEASERPPSIFDSQRIKGLFHSEGLSAAVIKKSIP